MNEHEKFFVVDTNVFLHDPNALLSFDDNVIVIPLIVLEEVDRKKDRADSVGANARSLCRHLDMLRKRGSLRHGVKLDSGGTVCVMSPEDFQGLLPDDLNDSHPDNMIIAVAKGLADKYENASVTLVTKDINMRIKCNVIGIPCEDYLRFRVAKSTDELYTGVKYTNLNEELEQQLLTGHELDDAFIAQSMLPNEFLVSENVTCRMHPDGRILRVNDGYPTVFDLTALNNEQSMALRLLLDDRISLVTLVGGAGCGKTIMAVAAALHLLFDDTKYDRLIVSRPVQPVGKDIGYLPGTKQEKMDPWLQPIYDNVKFIMGNRDDMFNMWMEKGKVEIEAISHIRGRSIANAFVIIDEAQNLSVHELKTIITRAGNGTKIVLTGDIEQVDNSLVDTLSNGLTYAVEKFKKYAIAGHITLREGVRSELATLAAKIL